MAFSSPFKCIPALEYTLTLATMLHVHAIYVQKYVHVLQRAPKYYNGKTYSSYNIRWLIASLIPVGSKVYLLLPVHVTLFGCLVLVYIALRYHCRTNECPERRAKTGRLE